MKSGSNLERILESGQFAVTAEAGPPKGSSPKVVQRKGELLKLCCDALNVTDNQTAIVRMSSLSGCVLLKEMGVEPVLQMVVRDRNRLALQGDILGAAALGIRNVLCLSGDHQKFGNHPTAKGVYDIDSIQFIQMVKTMRDEHKFLNGEEISGDVPFFIGAAANPFADPFEFRVIRLAKKVSAGADFIQTQGIFDMPKFIEWMKMVRDRGLDEKTHILAGLIPIKSVGMARYMRNNVSGLSVPKEIVDRMADAKEPKEEGVKICLETIEQLKEVDGIHGIHIMAVAWEDIVSRIIEEAGLMPRPVV
ncbi:MAG: methylenetetrahydrofolate reductase [Deltaproteobacteria bacterium]|nr:methylenetetrahydrofolate reductase [Deltaproteobacteria bacterium]MBW1793226.1 methylenetetrahydrofolate reductase [Deltaproteobacteria bacterium]MBW2331641.1 methylenetetrahydrofolate reductase [Deltaproteobacteria bacterium]